MVCRLAQTLAKLPGGSEGLQNHTVTEYVFREHFCDSVSKKQSLYRENFQISVFVKQ
jgi:hypothetical protein